MSGQDWTALGNAARRRRLSLNLSHEEIGRTTGPSHQTVRQIERAERTDYRPATLARLERALKWRAGLADEVLAGTATEEEIMGDRESNQLEEPIADRLEWLADKIIGDVESGRIRGIDAAPALIALAHRLDRLTRGRARLAPDVRAALAAVDSTR